MKGVLRIMVDIYQPGEVDWMNFCLAKGNPFTYHHIVESCNGGDKSLDNGAILTRHAHHLLNIFLMFCPGAYNALQEVFNRINKSRRPPAEEIIREVDEILYKALITREYKWIVEVDLSFYIVPYVIYLILKVKL